MKRLSFYNFRRFFWALRREPWGVVFKNVYNYFNSEDRSESLEIHNNNILTKVSSLDYKLYFEVYNYDGYSLEVEGWIYLGESISAFILVNKEKVVQLTQDHIRVDVAKSLGRKDVKYGFKYTTQIIRPLDSKWEVVVESKSLKRFEYIPLNLNRIRRPCLGISKGIAENSKPLVILPVYNGFIFLEELFTSIRKTSQDLFDLVIIEDCSTDFRVRPFLEKVVSQMDNASLVLNEKNIGFVQSCNKGFELAVAKRTHCLIINSDIVLPSNFVRIFDPFSKDSSIGTITPFTNSGTICSFPKINEDNPFEEYELLDGLNELLLQFRDTLYEYETIPTGVGFCMAINFKLLNQIRSFDVAFGKGYGEENDFCQKAQLIGFKNIKLQSMFVFHKHGGSFGESKQNLLSVNLPILKNRFPKYHSQVLQYFRNDLYQSLRELVSFVFNNTYGKHIELIFDNSMGGGANMFRLSLIDSIIDRNNLPLIYDYQASSLSIYSLDNPESINISSKELSYLACLNVVKVLHINSIVNFNINTSSISFLQDFKQKGTRLVYYYHDHFTICPSYKLWSSSHEFCGIPDLIQCQECLSSISHLSIANRDISQHREQIKELLLRELDEIVFFSNNSLNLFNRVYDFPELIKSLVPHVVDYIDPLDDSFLDLRKRSDKKNICIFGNIERPKGSAIVTELSKNIPDNYSFKLLGNFYNFDKSMPREIKNLGGYKRDEIADKVYEHNISAIFVPSLWPETFCFTAEEAYHLGIPLIIFNIGAHYDRLKGKENVLVLDRFSSTEKIWEQIENFLSYEYAS